MIIYRFFSYLIKNIKYTKILNKVYKDENILTNLSKLFGTEFRKDWIGRIYAVINPSIYNGEYDPNKQIFEYGKDGELSNHIFVEQQIMEKLNIAQQFIQARNLFDLLTYEIKKIDEYGNYLFIIQPITLPDCLEYTKKFTIIYSILIIIGIILGIFIF